MVLENLREDGWKKAVGRKTDWTSVNKTAGESV